MITQDEVRKLFHYDPETGIFTRLQKSGKRGKGKPGDVVGKPGKSRYLYVKINYVKYSLHELVWLYVYGYIPPLIDHKNRNPLDNRLSNLRLANHQQNMANRKVAVNNTSGVSGVCWSKTKGKWRVYCRDGKRQKDIGYFESFEEAVSARIKAARDLYGEFAP